MVHLETFVPVVTQDAVARETGSICVYGINRGHKFVAKAMKVQSAGEQMSVVSVGDEEFHDLNDAANAVARVAGRCLKRVQAATYMFVKDAWVRVEDPLDYKSFAPLAI